MSCPGPGSKRGSGSEDSFGFKAGPVLHFAVCFDVMLGRVLGVLGCMDMVSVGQVRVMGSRFVVAFQMMFGGFVMVARSEFMMLCRLCVMMGCFV